MICSRSSDTRLTDSFWTEFTIKIIDLRERPRESESAGALGVLELMLFFQNLLAPIQSGRVDAVRQYLSLQSDADDLLGEGMSFMQLSPE